MSSRTTRNYHGSKEMGLLRMVDAVTVRVRPSTYRLGKWRSWPIRSVRFRILRGLTTMWREPHTKGADRVRNPCSTRRRCLAMDVHKKPISTGVSEPGLSSVLVDKLSSDDESIGMMELTADMKRVVAEQQLGFVATVTPDGHPNLSPKGTTVVIDDCHLLFADVASPNTVRNLSENPHIEINVVDPIVRKGYRFRGTATVHTDGDSYEHGLALLLEQGSSLTSERVRSIVVVEVVEAAVLVSPVYDEDVSEQSVAANWLAKVAQLYRDRFSS